MSERYLSVMSERHRGPAWLAEREGVPITTVYNWNSTGDGPRFMKIGRHVRYRLADVLAWEQSRLVDRGHNLGGDAA
jgi:predicted DNA-binding transcriptional regulator AlpA